MPIPPVVAGGVGVGGGGVGVGIGTAGGVGCGGGVGVGVGAIAPTPKDCSYFDFPTSGEEGGAPPIGAKVANPVLVLAATAGSVDELYVGNVEVEAVADGVGKGVYVPPVCIPGMLLFRAISASIGCGTTSTLPSGR